jgi:hypothetical protein
MTWSAKLKVQDVSDGPAPIDVLAVATAEDGDDAIISNTEGKIRAIELRIQLDADETTVQVGDEIRASGHFTGV